MKRRDLFAAIAGLLALPFVPRARAAAASDEIVRFVYCVEGDEGMIAAIEELRWHDHTCQWQAGRPHMLGEVFDDHGVPLVCIATRDGHVLGVDKAAALLGAQANDSIALSYRVDDSFVTASLHHGDPAQHGMPPGTWAPGDMCTFTYRGGSQ